MCNLGGRYVYVGEVGMCMLVSMCNVGNGYLYVGGRATRRK